MKNVGWKVLVASLVFWGIFECTMPGRAAPPSATAKSTNKVSEVKKGKKVTPSAIRIRLPSAFVPQATNELSELRNIQLPEDFQIRLYADGLPDARSMTISPKGVLFVGTRNEGSVYAVVNSGSTNGASRQVFTVARDLMMPNGVAFANGALYIAELTQVLKLADIEQKLDNPPEPEVISTEFPFQLWHGWKFMAVGPDGNLYISVGVPCNVCEPNSAIYGTITRMNQNGSGLEIYASGIRNSVGFDWDPLTRELWFTDNGRDYMGDNLPPDELNHAPRKDMNFGFPYCHGKGIPDPEFNKGKDCSQFTAATVELGPHVAALGMRFYTGTQFPLRYRNGIFIAEHGSWNRSVPIGYRVTFIPMQAGQPQGYEVFAEGWLQKGKPWGRPVDVLQMPDGSLLVSDDAGGRIYQISYVGE